MMFVNSDLGNSYLAEEPVVSDAESTSNDNDVGYVDFWLSCYITYF
jgi:hypothetical protein